MKFTEGSEFFFVVFVEEYDFNDLGGCVNVIDWSRSVIRGWCEWISVVDRVEI